ncbi:hypothetical protein KR215_005826 [Drosophila sulfurigaster]|nr:hypothetical protein KR215_005826 [Drosophila sulfurigaster]
MPRTKIPKNSKRNREAANREEKIRVYELKTDSIHLALEDKETRYKSMTDTAIQLIQSRLQSELCNMKMSEFLDIIAELEHFDDFKASDQTQHIATQSMCNSTINGGGGASNDGGSINCGSALAANSRNDEGYLTEDSGMGGGAISISGSINNNISGSSNSVNAISTMSAYNGAAMRSARAMRTPGPLHSARARRERRSRSACGSKLGQAVGGATTTSSSNSSSNAHRNSRSKLRTPMASRPKAFSADRTARKPRPTSSPSTPPMAFLRWPKPGEVALSQYGSPIVSQVMPDKFANVNIPIRNGVLSLRPRKLGEIKADLLENLDADTLNQIKTLHENLQLIVDTASKAGLK